MPISMNLSLDGKILKLPDIRPLGPPHTITDNNPEQARIIVVSCNPLDDGGLVYETNIDNQILLVDGLIRVLVDDRESMVLEAVLGKSGIYERDIFFEHRIGHLMLRHY